jgi:WD40 repeat protein
MRYEPQRMPNAKSLALAILFGVPTFASAGAQQPNPLNLWSVRLSWRGDSLVVAAPRKLTHDDGTNSQPAFTPDGRAIVFSATRDTGSDARSDIYRLDLSSLRETRVTHTPENENSPTVNARGEYVAVRWIPATLFKEYGPWVYAGDGTPVRAVLPRPDTTGYYTPLESGAYALTRPKSKTFTIALFDSAHSAITDVDSGVPALPAQRIPGERALSYVHIDSANGRHQIMRLDLTTRRVTPLAPTLVWREVHAWIPAHNTMLMAKGNVLYRWRVGRDREWHPVATFASAELANANAYVVSPQGDRLIMTSPVHVPLGTMLRDSLGAGRSAADVVRLALSMQHAGTLKAYDVREGALLTFGADRLQHGTAGDAAAVDSLVTMLFPTSHRAYAALGDARRARADKPGAIAAYKRALELNPRISNADRAAASSVEQKLKDLGG